MEKSAGRRHEGIDYQSTKFKGKGHDSPKGRYSVQIIDVNVNDGSDTKDGVDKTTTASQETNAFVDQPPKEAQDDNYEPYYYDYQYLHYQSNDELWCAFIWGCQKHRFLLYPRKFIFVTDHMALKAIQTMAFSRSLSLRWQK